MANKIVEFEGPTNSKIYIVGEAPGRNEEIEGKPFVGGAGRILNRMLMEVGLTRGECRIGNVMRVRPPGNNFKKHFYVGKTPTKELIEGRKYLVEDISRCKPNVVCAFGNEALTTLTGEYGVTNWRGSVLWGKEVGCKVVPTMHPASLMRNWDYLPLVMFDLRKMKKESKVPEYVIPNRNFILAPTFEQCMSELDRINRNAKRITFDVETTGTMLTALAIADSPYSAISVPFTIASGAPYWRIEEELAILYKIKEVMENGRIEKIAQNAQFDILILRSSPPYIRVNKLVLDTMCAHHSIYPELPKGLDVICSIYTKQPYYKHWGKAGKDVTFWKYNAMDACVTYEASIQIEKEMREFGVYEFYYDMVHPLIPILTEMQLRGVKIDKGIREDAKEDCYRKVANAQDLLEQAVGRPVNVMSPKQLKELLYKDMKLPAKYKRSTGKITTDEEALLTLSKRHPSPIFDLILSIRHNRKLLGTYLVDKGGEDDRIRCSYIIGGTETGRLSSRESIFGTGTNLQNIPKGICRRMFVADTGKTFIEADLSQAEARIVAYLSEEERLIELLERKGDIHTQSASWIFNTSLEKVTPKQRELAKRLVHASNYGIGPMTFAHHAGVSMSNAKKLLRRYFDTFPKIKAWHLGVQAQLSKSRTLTTPMGRKRTFFGMWGESLFREAYSYLPQSTVADVLNMAFIRTAGVIERGKFDAEIVLQVHDSFVVQVVSDKVKVMLDVMRGAFDISLFIKGRELVIPTTYKTGGNWDELG